MSTGTSASHDHADESWASMASWYDALLRSGSGPHELATATTLALAGDVTGQSVLDVACGQGIASRALAHAGAGSVTGIDSASEMIAAAEAYEVDAAIRVRYRVDDAEVLTSVDDDSFDGVTCQLGLMDIPDLDATLRAIRRVLHEHGWFVFVIGHPCFLAPDASTLPGADGVPGRFVSDYFEERFWRSSTPGGVRRAGNHHRTLSTYVNALGAAGFVLERLVEPAAPELLAAQQPVFANVPIFLAGRARPIVR